MVIGERIEALMVAKGLTQAELARRVGVSQPTIYGLIRLNKNGSVHLHKVARELSTTAAYLSGETDDPSSDIPIEEYSSEERHVVAMLRECSHAQRDAVVILLKSIVSESGGSKAA